MLNKRIISELTIGDCIQFLNGQLRTPDGSMSIFCPLQAEILEMDRRWDSDQKKYFYRFRSVAANNSWSIWFVEDHRFTIVSKAKHSKVSTAPWTSDSEKIGNISID
jgi:hypothetical protein